MQKLRDRHINIDKAATMSIVINCVEVVLLVALLVADMFDLSEELLRIVRPFSTVALVVLIVEGLTSVRDGFVWKKTNQQNEMLREAFDQLDDLNTQMRKQRHDFLNHLQVVYSLVDMGENAEATKYIETVYGQMHRLSAGMKTDKPAINALLQAKLGDAERRGVRMELDVTSRYANLPMNDWEMCRVLGNLIDNAMDAMEEAFGVAPVNKGEGGSIPFIPELQRIFPKAQVLVTGPEDPKANAHSPNESISLPALKNNVITEALLLDKLAK